MQIGLPLFVSLGLLITMTCLSLGLGFALPADTQLPIHFTLLGLSDRTASAPFALTLLPVAGALATLAFALVARLSPRLQRFQGRYVAFWLLAILIMALGHGLVIRGAIIALRAANGA